MQRAIAIILLFVISFACKKDQNPVPKAPDNFFLNITSDPQLTSLLAPYNAVIVTGGYRKNGVIVFRTKMEGTIDDFVAYDRTCTYEVDTSKMLWTIKNPYFCTCSYCKSKFNLLGGYMENGPATYSLRKYNCDFVDGVIHVY
jgi:Rieske Fe-S protein